MVEFGPVGKTKEGIVQGSVTLGEDQLTCIQRCFAGLSTDLYLLLQVSLHKKVHILFYVVFNIRLSQCICTIF